MMDLSKLSDSDILALNKGDLGGLSNEALTMLGESTPQESQPAASQIISPNSGGGAPLQKNSSFDVAMGGLNRGFASVPDSILNTPTNIMNLGKAAFGSGAIALGRPDLAPDISETPDYFRKLFEKAGAINPSQNPTSEGQKTLQALSGGVGAGVLSPAASWPQVINNGILGGVSSVAGKATEDMTGNQGLGVAASLLAPAGMIPAGRAAGRGASVAGKHVLGMTTGVGPENIGAAAKSGYSGKTSFFDNLSGEVPKTDVLDQARQALGTIRNERSNKYQSGIASTAADQTPLDFSPIDSALAKVSETMKFGEHSKIGESEAGKIGEIQDVVAEWRNDPTAHTAIGLDALKQRIDAIDVPIGSNQAKRAKTAVRNAVKNTIVEQSPEYSGTMKAYEESKSLEDEITRALSLGDNASADTSLRKLQSLARNNANANYGYRLDLANALESQGGKDLMPAIAGQAMNSWTPRGLMGQGEGLATLGYGLSHPSVLALLPFQSPKVVGSALYGAGRLAGKASEYLPSLPQGLTMEPSPGNLATMLMYQNSRLDRRNGRQGVLSPNIGAGILNR